ncbi:MAG: FAD-dependent oxidoreductase [Niabella sp.]
MQHTLKYDIVILGSGLGGLLCANILALEGFKVCVLEKNQQFGGNLQTFSRDKQIFDTGVHYIGGLDAGQNLYQVFKYVGLMEHLKLERMDPCFDRILIGKDQTVYCQTQGYDAFIKELAAVFPQEEKNIVAYCERVKQVCTSFPLYHLTLKNDQGNIYSGNNESAKQVIESIISDKKLQAVLAGNNLLYAGAAAKTPFHLHALIINSYIESSWKCIGGGSQIAKILVAGIRKQKGNIVRNTEVKKITEENGRVTCVETAQGNRIYGDRFISNIHPAATLRLIQSERLKGLYRKRITNLEQTISSFSVHLVLKEKTVPYQNSNYYYHKEGQVWNQGNYTEANWPLGYGLYFTEDSKNKGFAATISILTVMRFEEVTQWADTYNRAGKAAERGTGYDVFKQKKADRVLRLVGERFPEVIANIKYCYASTPLTNRDYIGDITGSMYGIQKDFQDPLKTMISPRTKIPNLFLTGQNLNLHGILGTSLSAVLTCVLLLEDHSLADKIKNA